MGTISANGVGVAVGCCVEAEVSVLLGVGRVTR